MQKRYSREVCPTGSMHKTSALVYINVIKLLAVITMYQPIGQRTYM